MKKMKALGLSLACLLPFTANAADICLQVAPANHIFKFKKPSVAKSSATAVFGMFISPTSTGAARVGYASIRVMARADGTLDYLLFGQDDASDKHFQNGGMNFTYMRVRAADKKTFAGTIDPNSFSEGYDVTDQPFFLVPTGVSVVKCKAVLPASIDYDYTPVPPL